MEKAGVASTYFANIIRAKKIWFVTSAPSAGSWVQGNTKNETNQPAIFSHQFRTKSYTRLSLLTSQWSESLWNTTVFPQCIKWVTCSDIIDTGIRIEILGPRRQRFLSWFKGCKGERDLWKTCGQVSWCRPSASPGDLTIVGSPKVNFRTSTYLQPTFNHLQPIQTSLSQQTPTLNASLNILPRVL